MRRMIMLLAHCVIHCETSQDTPIKISVNHKKVPLKLVLQQLAKITNRSIILDFPDATYCTSLSMSGDFQSIAEQLCGDRFCITEEKDLTKISDSLYIKIYKIHTINNEAKWAQFEKLLSHVTKSYSVDHTNGTLVITGNHTQHNTVRNLIREIEKDAQQTINVQVTFITVVLNKDNSAGIAIEDIVENLGVDLSYSADGVVIHAGDVGTICRFLGKYGSVDSKAGIGMSIANNECGTIKMISDSAYFSFEEIALTTNSKSNIAKLPQSKLHKIDTGTVLTICPIILPDSVSMNLEFSHSWVAGKQHNPVLLANSPGTRHHAEILDGSTVPLIDTQYIKTTIACIKPGESVLLGGFNHSVTKTERKGLPFIARWLPFNIRTEVVTKQTYIHISIKDKNSYKQSRARKMHKKSA